MPTYPCASCGGPQRQSSSSKPARAIAQALTSCPLPSARRKDARLFSLSHQSLLLVRLPGDWSRHKRLCGDLLAAIILPPPSKQPALDPFYEDPISRGRCELPEHVHRHKILVALTPSYLDFVTEDIFSAIAKVLSSLQRERPPGKLVNIFVEFAMYHPAGVRPPSSSFGIEHIKNASAEETISALYHADGRYTRTVKLYTPGHGPPNFVQNYMRQTTLAEKAGGSSITVAVVFKLTNMDRPRDLVDDHHVVIYRDFDPSTLEDDGRTFSHFLEDELYAKFGPRIGSGYHEKKPNFNMMNEVRKKIWSIARKEDSEEFKEVGAIMLRRAPKSRVEVSLLSLSLSPRFPAVVHGFVLTSLIKEMHRGGKEVGIEDLDNAGLLEIYRYLFPLERPSTTTT
ncbi:hypothetical protein P7C70_g4765, partial [Phenoliferia sp. Uapishka_3]